MGRWAVAIVCTTLGTVVGCGKAGDSSDPELAGGGQTDVARAGGGGAAQAGAGTALGGSAGIGGAGAGTTSGGAGSAGAPCQPEAHERPLPGVLTRTFAEVAADLVGVYRITDVYTGASDCTAMCRLGDTVDASYADERFIALTITNGGVELLVDACPTQDCTTDAPKHQTLGGVSHADSDRVLSEQNTFVQLPQGGVCSGYPNDTWLISDGAGRIRLDQQQIRVTFPPSVDPDLGLDVCYSEAVRNAALGKACNFLTVVDAERVK